MNTTILTALTGSMAHGLSGPDSDVDTWGCFITPTRELLSLGNIDKKQVGARRTDEDHVEWEVGHFLHLATKCNPTVLEAFLAPVQYSDQWGDELRSLFPYVWNSKGVVDAFIGYSQSQRTKFIEKHHAHKNKLAVAYLRVLYQAHELLRTGTFNIRVGDSEIGETLKQWKAGNYTFDEVILTCQSWHDKVKAAYEANPKKKSNLTPLNDYLLRLRKEWW